ncbi:hypothetical protein ACI65C_006883 [Semiaphis heraclei]
MSRGDRRLYYDKSSVSRQSPAIIIYYHMFKMSFSPENDELLIEEVRQNTVLYNSQDIKHKDIIYKDEIWKNIAGKVGKSKALRHYNIIPSSPITCLRAGIQLEGYAHILSFRRQLFVKAEDIPKMPSSILINYDGINHRIFITDDQVTCFSCKMSGHVASKCPFSVESQTDNIEDCSEPTDLINFIDNTDSNTLTENTRNNDLINNDNLEMEIDQTTTTDKGGIKRAASNSTTSNVTQEPISVINKTGTKTTEEKKQTITVATATKIQKVQIIKKIQNINKIQFNRKTH